MSYSAEQLYFGPLQMQARSEAFLAKWQRLLRYKQRTLDQLAEARQALPEQKVVELTQEVRWITELLV